MTEHQPDESKLERVIRKIKRCLALSQSGSEHEAATAMRQAQALMRNPQTHLPGALDKHVRREVALLARCSADQRLYAGRVVAQKKYMPATPRGVRNNNPGNIDYNPRNAWVGQLGLEPKTAGVPNPRFALFDCAENRIRAIGKLVLVCRGNENNTAAYIAAVAKRMVVLPGVPLVLGDFKTLLGLVMGIINHESGGIPYAQAVIEDGVRRALAWRPRS